MTKADVTVNLNVEGLEAVKAAIAQLRKERDEARAELKRARDYAKELFDESVQDGCDYGDLLQQADVAVSLVEDALHLAQHGKNVRGGDETWREFESAAQEFMARHGTAIALEAAKSRRELADETGKEYDQWGDEMP